MGPYRESRLKSLILVVSAIITLAGCATSVNFQTADQSTTVDGTLFKPDGAGPFPGVVLLHGCGGIRPHFVQWAGAIRDMGYVALLVDSFRPRGISAMCASSQTMASMTTDRAADAYGALRHLKALPFVDGDRVALMGWSHGGSTTLEAMASWRYRSSPDQFRAAIAFYPYCRDALNEPFRVPLLVLIGGSDDWTPAKKCEDMQARLRLMNPDAAQSLRVQVYQGAHHDFDDVAAKHCCGHTLRYNRDAAKDAEDQVRRFLAENMKGAQREGGR
jgi:dienelactone hydrolase